MEKTTLDSTNLLASLREANAGLLNKAGIYSVLDYAWEDEDTPSSKLRRTGDVDHGRSIRATFECLGSNNSTIDAD